MFTVVRGEYIRQSLESAINLWWERHELPNADLLRDGLVYLEQGGQLNEGQRAILLRAALSYAKGVRTALRHQTNPERTAVLLNDSLLMAGSRWSEDDLRQWLQQDPHVNQWRPLLRSELQTTNQIALPSQRRKIQSLLDIIRDTEKADPPAAPSHQDLEVEMFAEAALAASAYSARTSKLRYVMAALLLLLLAGYFYQRYAPILGQSDMLEVTASFQPVRLLALVTPTPSATPIQTATPTQTAQPEATTSTLITTQPEIAVAPDVSLQPQSPLQVVSPLAVENPPQPDSPLQPVSPLQPASATPTEVPTATSTETPTEVPTATPLPTATATFSPTPQPSATGVTTTTSTGADQILLWEPDVGNVQPVVRTLLIDRSEVTNAEYRKCVAAEKCPAPLSNQSATRQDYFLSTEFDDYPVVNVDLLRAVAYCEFRGKRLPSAEEWEAAASLAPATNRHYRYPWGDQFIAQYANSAESNHKDTTIVGAYRPRGNSPLGFDDMAGNVAEWTSTIIVEEGVLKAVAKGGSYQDNASELLADSLKLLDVSSAEPWLGFRCAR